VSRNADHTVHEAVGRPLSPVEAAAAIFVGVNPLIIAGILSVLFGAMAHEGRLNVAQIGQVITCESLAMGLATALAGMVLKPHRLKTLGCALGLALAGLDFFSTSIGGGGVILLRALAGVIEGVLLWVSVSMIARAERPERWSGIYFTGMVVAQFFIALAFAKVLAPRWGSAGGFYALSALCVVSAAVALLLPSRLADLPPAEDGGSLPPLRGWFALFATMVFVAGGGAANAYLQPIAEQAGLTADVARTSFWVSLALQIGAGLCATFTAGRIRYFQVFLVTALAQLWVWWTFGHHPAAGLFIAANAVWGFFAVLLGPFIVPLLIDADPSRRAAVQGGACQVLGGALGPFAASWVVSGHDTRSVIVVAMTLLVTGLCGIALVRFAPRRARAAAS
jgi:hypothetical protein